MFTHIQAIDLFKQFATKHLQVRSMGAGDYPDIAAEKLMLYYDPANANKVIYPLVWVIPFPAQMEGKELTLHFGVQISDLVNDDNSNLQEVLNDTLLIHTDLFAVLQDPLLSDNYAIGQSISYKPFMDSLDDAVAGWEGEITFRVKSLRDRCVAVMSAPLTIPEDTEAI